MDKSGDKLGKPIIPPFPPRSSWLNAAELYKGLDKGDPALGYGLRCNLASLLWLPLESKLRDLVWKFYLDRNLP